MSKIVRMTIVSAAMILLAGAAQAETWRGVDISSAARNFTPIQIQPAACRGWGPYCGPGFTRVCGRWRCWCRPCW
jgi:hypothetical protein